MVFCLKKMWTISDKYNIIRWHYFLIIFKSCEAGGRVAKLADAHGSEPCSRKAIRVQVPSRPPFLQDKHGSSFFVEKKERPPIKVFGGPRAGEECWLFSRCIRGEPLGDAFLSCGVQGTRCWSFRVAGNTE